MQGSSCEVGVPARTDFPHPRLVKTRSNLWNTTMQRTMIFGLVVALLMTLSTAMHAQTDSYVVDFTPRTFPALQAGEFSTIGSGSPNFASISTGNVIFGGTPFSFRFFDVQVSNFYVMTNGQVVLNTPLSIEYPNFPINDATKTSMYAMIFHDTIGGGQYIRYGVRGTAPYRQFLVEYDVVHTDPSNNGRVIGQIAFFETTDIVEFRYGDPADQDWGQLSATVGLKRAGIEYVAGDIASEAGNWNSAPVTNMRFTPVKQTNWTGANSTTWSDAGNWSNGVPSSNSWVRIPTGVGNIPHVTANTSIGRLQLDPEAELVIDNARLNVLARPFGHVDIGSESHLTFEGTGSLAVAGNFFLDRTAELAHTIGGIKQTVTINSVVWNDMSNAEPLVFNGPSPFNPQNFTAADRDRFGTQTGGEFFPPFRLPPIALEADPAAPALAPKLLFTTAWEAGFGNGFTLADGSVVTVSADVDLSGYELPGGPGANPVLTPLGDLLLILETQSNIEFTFPAGVTEVDNIIFSPQGAGVVTLNGDLEVSTEITFRGSGRALIQGDLGTSTNPVPLIRSSDFQGDLEVQGDMFYSQNTILLMDQLNSITIAGDLICRTPQVFLELNAGMNVGGDLRIIDPDPSTGFNGTLTLNAMADVTISDELACDGSIAIAGAPNVILGGLITFNGDVQITGADTLSVGTTDSDPRDRGVFSATGTITLDVATSIDVSALVGDSAALIGSALVLDGAANFNHNVSGVTAGTIFVEFFEVPADGTTLTFTKPGINTVTEVYEFNAVDPANGNIWLNTSSVLVGGNVPATLANVRQVLLNALNSSSILINGLALNQSIVSTPGQSFFSVTGLTSTDGFAISEAGDTAQSVRAWGFQSVFGVFTINGSGNLTFGGEVRFAGNINDNGTGSLFTSPDTFAFAALTPMSINATTRSVSAGRLIIGQNANVTFTGSFRASAIGLVSPALQVIRGGTLTLTPNTVINVGATGGEALVSIDGRLRTATGAGITRPAIVGPTAKESHYRMRFSPTGIAEVDGLVLRNIGNSFATYGLFFDSGALVQRFDNVSLLDVQSVTAAIAMRTGTLPLQIVNLEVDGKAPRNIDASSITGGFNQTTNPYPDALVKISAGPNNGGSRYGTNFELDTNHVLEWELLNTGLVLDQTQMKGPNQLPDIVIETTDYSFFLRSVQGTGNPPFRYTYFSSVNPVTNDWLDIDSFTGEFKNRQVDIGGGVFQPKPPTTADINPAKIIIARIEDNSRPRRILNLTTTSGSNLRIAVTDFPAPPLEITTDPDLGQIFEFDSQTAITFQGTGGRPFPGGNPYRWSIISGTTPPGMPNVIFDSGVWAGTPDDTAVKTFNFTVEMEDSTGATTTKSFNLTVEDGDSRPIPNILSLPDGEENAAYSFKLTVKTGTGRPPIVWVLDASSESLPTGLNLREDGLLSGLPRAGTGVGTGELTIAGKRRKYRDYRIRFQIRDAYFPTPPTTTTNLLTLRIIEEDLPAPSLTGETTVGGGCSMTSSTSSTAWMLALVGGAAVMLRRRRRENA